MSSGATTSAGQAKKLWGRWWEGVVAIGVALGIIIEQVLRHANAVNTKAEF
jgi:hypothetical protein